MAVPFTSVKGNTALRKYLRELAQAMRAGAAPYNASGRLGESITSEITEIARAGATGRILALDYWTNVGSGTPPGTRVSVESLTEWAIVKRLYANEKSARKFATSVAARIEASGSRDYRRGGENVFLAAIEEAQPDIQGVINAFMNDLDDAVSREFIAGKQAA